MADDAQQPAAQPRAASGAAPGTSPHGFGTPPPPSVLEIPAAELAGIRLIVSDMDGTLLDHRDRLPPALWGQLARLRAAGIAFAPASGRPYATLGQLFVEDAPAPRSGEPYARGMFFLAENGGFVVRDDAQVSAQILDPGVVRRIVEASRSPELAGLDAGIIVCGARGARVERGDERFLAEVRRYYSALDVAADVLAFDLEGGDSVTGPIVKLSAYAFSPTERLAEVFAGITDPAGHRTVISGQSWIDMMRADTDKGAALRSLQAHLGVGRAQTMVFGDFHNDLGMLTEAGIPVAMANAHPDVLAAARFTAPPNTAAGVSQVIEAVLRAQGA
ncbi:HAD family hydrolase [Brevibacterium sp. BRM-1]|uniref:HAD hydrolase family protein n=1 Tax=Brevibacterium sp. BRM-1 TaxID=2999062 RepID=UPI00227FC109|nr:HAD family hydrolase [Brevibacterium sp. BRM-1]WAL39829.1 HAD family hydrolase [Brevibacterium sp. BRM-1]